MAGSRPVPNNIWLCGNCKVSNLVANAPSRCPACSHYRDYQVDCCTNPGEPYPQSTVLFPDYPEYQDTYHLASQGAYYPDSSISTTGYYERQAIDSSFAEPADFGDQWHCNECGADNLDWCEEQCPVCGAGRPNSAHFGISQAFTSFAGAGSPDPDAWICAECGSANSGFFDTECGACGASKP